MFSDFNEIWTKTLNYITTHKWKVVIAIVILVVILLIAQRNNQDNYVENVPEFERFKMQPERSWNDVIQDMSLDPAVKKSHEKFVSSQNMVPQAANLTVREQVEETPFVGLRRPNYNVPVSKSARVQTSAYLSSMPVNNRTNLF